MLISCNGNFCKDKQDLNFKIIKGDLIVREDVAYVAIASADAKLAVPCISMLIDNKAKGNKMEARYELCSIADDGT